MVKVLGERVLIEKPEEEEKEEDVKQTDSGIYLVGDDPTKSSTTQYYIEAEVKAAGTECKEVNIGDTIIFDKRAGVDIEIEGTVYQMFKENNIIAIKSRQVS